QSVEEAWLRLRRQLDLADEFWLGFVFSSSMEAIDLLQRRTQNVLRQRARALKVIEPPDAESLAELPKHLLPTVDAEPWEAITLVWLRPAALDGDRDAWDDAWIRSLGGLNQLRDPLRRRLQGGLVIVLPSRLRGMVAAAAPDL